MSRRARVVLVKDGVIAGTEDDPPVGASVRARFVGYSGSGQLRLSLRRS
jgi:hypothetical protein